MSRRGGPYGHLLESTYIKKATDLPLSAPLNSHHPKDSHDIPSHSHHARWNFARHLQQAARRRDAEFDCLPSGVRKLGCATVALSRSLYQYASRRASRPRRLLIVLACYTRRHDIDCGRHCL